MDWNGLIFSALSIIITGLATWAMGLLTKWLNDKLENKKSKEYVDDILQIVTGAVKKTYQSYVESIKGTDMWTAEAQQKALNIALGTAREAINLDTAQYISEKYGDIDTYLTNLIESVLYDLKNK